MTLLEKIQLSADKTRFTLFKEGIFYKCYNEDAMVFVQRVKSYKINTKFIKNVGAEVLSLGFPVSETKKGHLSFENISGKIGAKGYEVKAKHIVFQLGNADTKKDYGEWKETIPIDQNRVVAKEPVSEYSSRHDMTGLVKMIKNYDLANSTPMQGLNFIQQLKSELHQIEEDNGNI